MTVSTAIRRLKHGDIGGLETLISCYQVKALRTAFLIVHDQQLAEDIVQDVFIRVHQRIRWFDENRPFEPYLMRSVINLTLNTVVHRSLTVDLDADNENHKMETLLLHASTIENQVELSQLRDEIHAALLKLPPHQRAVIVQRYYLDMTEKEMAAVNETAQGTIKWWLHIAREQLRTLLSGHRREG